MSLSSMPLIQLPQRDFRELQMLIKIILFRYSKIRPDGLSFPESKYCPAGSNVMSIELFCLI